jgi:hypothetical protein
MLCFIWAYTILLLDDGLMTSTFGDYLCDGIDVMFFSGACCVMFHYYLLFP